MKVIHSTWHIPQSHSFVTFSVTDIEALKPCK